MVVAETRVKMAKSVVEVSASVQRDKSSATTNVSIQRTTQHIVDNVDGLAHLVSNV